MNTVSIDRVIIGSVESKTRVLEQNMYDREMAASRLLYSNFIVLLLVFYCPS
jgi:hypothetical protein